MESQEEAERGGLLNSQERARDVDSWSLERKPETWGCVGGRGELRESLWRGRAGAVEQQQQMASLARQQQEKGAIGHCHEQQRVLGGVEAVRARHKRRGQTAGGGWGDSGESLWRGRPWPSGPRGRARSSAAMSSRAGTASWLESFLPRGGMC